MAGPEKLFLFLDSSDELNEKMGARSRLDNAKRGLTTFIACKLRFCPATEVAVYTLDVGVKRVLDFTNNEQQIINAIWEMKTGDRYQSFDVQSVFEAVTGHPRVRGILDDPSAPACVRAVLLYGRSSIVPRNNTSPVVQEALRKANFYFDALYLHDKPTDNNHCQDVYDAITLMEDDRRPGGRGYFCENSTSARKLHQSFTYLLAHPRQRKEQAEFLERLREAPPVGGLPCPGDPDLIELPG